MDSVRHFINCGLEKLNCDFSRRFVVQFNVAIFRCAVDGYEHIEPPFFGIDIGYVDMEVTNGILFECLRLLFISAFGRRELPWC